MLRQPRRRPKVAPSGTYNDGWSDADNAALQKLLQPLRHDPPDIDPFGCFGSEARGLACASRDLVYDRTMSFLSTLNVMSGLVLAVIFEKALEQSKAEMTQQMVKMKKIEEGKVHEGNIL